jgi:hypothetical protein
MITNLVAGPGGGNRAGGTGRAEPGGAGGHGRSEA